jgi:RNA polymerase sigma factor (sigma-70 family)
MQGLACCAATGAKMDEREYRALSEPAYRLAARILGSAEGTEDVVQQALLAVVTRLRGGQPPRELRTWFLKVVHRTAWKRRRGEAARRRREVAVMRTRETVGNEVSPGLVEALREAMAMLGDEHRLPVALCCEEGLTQTEAAEVLDVPQRTISRRVNEGLELLRGMLVKAGWTAAPAVLMGALAHTAPPIPATLAAVVEKILAGAVGGVGSGSGSVGAAVGVAAKGGLAMKAILAVVLAGTVAAGAAGLSASGFRPFDRLTALSIVEGLSEPQDTGSGPAAAAAPATGANPVTGRQDREEVFEFTQKPTVTKQGDKVIIAFASKGKCDATVAIVGPDGKIVRHLASGVLGKNAPWPFKQDSLAQSLEWDGRDDFGKPAPAGCKVKVALGFKATFERNIGWDPNSLRPVQSIVVGKDGGAYVIAAGEVKVFDRDGKYLRTLLPFPGGADLSGGFPSVKTVWGDSIMLAGWFGPYDTLGGHLGTCALTLDEKQLLIYWSDGYQRAQLLKLDTKTGGLPPGSVVNLGSNYESRQKVGLWDGHDGPGVCVSLAFAPDGQTLYMSGRRNIVMRKKIDELKFQSSVGALLGHLGREKLPEAMMPERFLGQDGKPGSDNEHFNGTRGVATDKDGNVYVADFGNSRIQVFKSDGTFLKTLPIEAQWDPRKEDGSAGRYALQVAVHPKTGAVYYGSCPKRGVARLVKLGGLDDPTPKAAYETHISVPSDIRGITGGPAIGLDAGVDPTVVWFGVGGKVFRLLDKGGQFETIGEIAGKGSIGGPTRITVDRETETLYCSPGGISRPPWHKVDGHSGKRDESFKGSGWEDAVVASDGTILCRTPGYGRFVVRYDRNFKPKPFAKGVKIPQGEVPDGWPAEGPALYCGIAGHSNINQDGIAVNPVNGDIYVRAKEINAEWYAKAVPNGVSLPPDELAKIVDWLPQSIHSGGAGVRGLQGVLLVWDRDGNPKTAQAITGLIRGNGLRVDSAGGLYLSIGCWDPLKTGWVGLADPKSVHHYRNFGNMGTFVKFAGKGSFPMGSMAGGKADSAAWLHNVHAPSQPNDCGCCYSRFGSDGFDRLYVPAMHLYSVLVLDANGNHILRLGRRGNADNVGRGGDDPHIGIAWARSVEASDKAVYIGDAASGLIRKAAIGYAAEETVPVP